ncbi:MAG TPA: zinc-binding dehydrogenase [Solirubrobacteraceae bacterium]|nr:zinc-binding dehydrogenase [Solirubrobacteraceae bacterium]
MNAIRLHAFGPAGNLRYEPVADPEPGPGQVRIAVAAAGVHLIDTTIRSGVQMGPMPLPDLPAIPGREVAGTVDAVGPGVEPGWHGRRVVAHLGAASAGYAELAVREVERLHALPDGVAEDVAVAMIGTGRTAMAILDLARIGPGDVVLVTAAAGGLGALLTQAARGAGATVVGAAGPAKLDRVIADVKVDYTRPGWAAEVGEVTVVLDGVGGEAGRAAFELLARGGRHVLYGWSSGEMTRIATGDIVARSLTVSSALVRPGDLRALEERALAAAAAGRLVPLLTRFPLAEAAAAHAALEARETVGKVVLLAGPA